eukprot:356968-Chlamydomonas_euryale.AAC.22
MKAAGASTPPVPHSAQRRGQELLPRTVRSFPPAQIRPLLQTVQNGECIAAAALACCLGAGRTGTVLRRRRGNVPSRRAMRSCGARSRGRMLRPMPLCPQVLHSDIDLLNPPKEWDARRHKRKRLVQSPNSFFMDVKYVLALQDHAGVKKRSVTRTGTRCRAEGSADRPHVRLAARPTGARAASTSPPCLATPRLSFCAGAARRCCARPPVASAA